VLRGFFDAETFRGCGPTAFRPCRARVVSLRHGVAMAIRSSPSPLTSIDFDPARSRARSRHHEDRRGPRCPVHPPTSVPALDDGGRSLAPASGPRRIIPHFFTPPAGRRSHLQQGMGGRHSRSAFRARAQTSAGPPSGPHPLGRRGERVADAFWSAGSPAMRVATTRQRGRSLGCEEARRGAYGSCRALRSQARSARRASRRGLVVPRDDSLQPLLGRRPWT